MKWINKTAERELIKTFSEYIENNKSFLLSKKIYIWGAGVRGLVLGSLLEKNGIFEFKYVDNDCEKKNHYINDHIVINPDDELYSKDAYILVSVEYGEEIVCQLNQMGLCNFSWINVNIEDEFVNEYKRVCHDYSVIFGESILECVDIEDENDLSIKELIKTLYSIENNKVLSVNCMGMEMIYNLLRVLLKDDECPKRIILCLNYETFTPEHHKLPRVQHVNLLEKFGFDEVYFKEYINKAQNNAKNYLIEKEHAPQTTSESEMIPYEVQKQYLKESTLVEINNDIVEIKYLKKILGLLKNKRIECWMVQIPINHELGERMFPVTFSRIVKNKNLFMSSIAQEYNAKYIDLSSLLRENHFIAGRTIQDSITLGGKIKLLKEIKNGLI